MIDLLLAGVPGKMALELLACVPPEHPSLRILPLALSSARNAGSWSGGSRKLALLDAAAPATVEALRAALAGRSAIALDFTAPAAVATNARIYEELRLPFVMGTTGDTAPAVEAAKRADIPAVVYANMAAPIVAFLAALEETAKRFPGVLEGFTLRIEESHQAAKRDVSGTARRTLPLWGALGAAPAAEHAIESIRDPARQRELGVPEDSIGGHAYHTYRIDNPAQAVSLALSHRVHGRRVYAEGALRAARFLHRQVEAGAAPRVFTMIEVLEDREEVRLPGSDVW